MQAKFYIHIGIPKTGSSSIQQTLFKSREALFHHDINYLSISARHGALVTALVRGRIGRKIATAKTISYYRNRLMAELSANRCGKFVMSAEDLAQSTPDEIREFKRLLDPFALSYRIIVYIRNPYEYASSALMQAVKGPRGLTLQAAAKHLPLAQYRFRIEKYIHIFGRQNVDIRIFDRNRFVEGDLICDFLASLDEPPALKTHLSIVYANKSVSHEAAAILSEVNAVIPSLIGGKRNRGRAAGFGVLMESIEGVKFAVDPQAFGPYEERIGADLEWLHDQLGERVFERASPLPASVPAWGPETVRSIQRLVAEMRSRIVEQSGMRRALPAVPPEHAAWLQCGAQSSLRSDIAAFDSAHDARSIGALGCYLHDLALALPHMSARQHRSSRFLGTLPRFIHALPRYIHALWPRDRDQAASTSPYAAKLEYLTARVAERKRKPAKPWMRRSSVILIGILHNLQITEGLFQDLATICETLGGLSLQM